jgi:decaprenylphospho-beta-D-ribofuranose 2-oxidase
MIPSGTATDLTNWSKSACSPCFVYRAGSAAELTQALEAAQAQHLTVIPHGAGHSYTDAALNTHAAVIDVRPMRSILAWDPVRGILQAEPGVTLRDVVQVAWNDGWWPYAATSTPDVTIGGCAAMNVNGKNAWKDGPFGEHVIALDVLLASGETLVVHREPDPQLLQAFVGSLGLLGIITAITMQLQRMPSHFVTLRQQRAHSLADLFTRFSEQTPDSDFMEAWLDGFATGPRLGRGLLTSAAWSDPSEKPPALFPSPGEFERLEPASAGLSAGLPAQLTRLAGRLAQPVLRPGLRLANQAYPALGSQTARQLVPIPTATFWSGAAFAGYHAFFPKGVETFQAFVPGPQAPEVFTRLLRYSQQQDCWPVWCVIKQHRCDPFLLTYQVDGFSLELNYARSPAAGPQLQRVLQHMLAMVIESGGRFYLAKDHFLTHTQYRESLGENRMERFLELKQCYDPQMLLQSDLFRRLFQPFLL